MTHHNNTATQYNHLAGLEEFLDNLKATNPELCEQTVKNLLPMTRGNNDEPVCDIHEFLYLQAKYCAPTEDKTLYQICTQNNNTPHFQKTLRGNTYCSLGYTKRILCDCQALRKDHNNCFQCLLGTPHEHQ